VPEYASVSAPDPLLPWLAHREEIYFLHRYRQAEYLIFDRRLGFSPLMEIDGEVLVRQLLDSPEYQVVHCSEYSVVLKRDRRSTDGLLCEQFLTGK